MRQIASVVLKDGKVVQSFSYDTYLPLGRLEATLQNLQRWGVEEIVIKNLDKSDRSIRDVCKLIETSFVHIPITYGGNIRSKNDIMLLLDSGVDRFCFDASIINLQKHEKLHDTISNFTGRQSMIANLNVELDPENKIKIYDYYSKKVVLNLSNEMLKSLSSNFSEVIINDYRADGERKKFNINILKELKKKYNFYEMDILISGGVGFHDTPKTYQNLNYVDGVILGNSLYRDENSYQNWKIQNG